MRTLHRLGICFWCVGLAALSCVGSRQNPNAGSAVLLEDLTPRERRDFEMMTKDLQAPCVETPQSVAECSQRPGQCRGCNAARMLLLKGLRDGHSREQIQAAYQARFEPFEPSPIDLTDAPMLGQPDAPVTIIEFADYQCPYCAATAGIIDATLKEYPKHVKVYFKHYPLAGHVHAEIAARAAVAAQRQGRFWEMHHKMFENQRALTDQDLEQYAREVGLDLARFRADLAATDVAARVKRDQSEAGRLRLSGTPSIFVNGRQFPIKMFDLSSDLSAWVQGEIEIKTGVVVAPAPLPSGSAVKTTPPSAPPLPPTSSASSSPPPAIVVTSPPSASAVPVPSAPPPPPSASSAPKPKKGF